MRASKLDQRISISVNTVTGRNSFGEDIFGAPVVSTFWAQVEFLQGREFEAVSQRFAEARYTITMRRQPGVTIARNSTITWNGLSLDILDVRGPGTREPLWVITAKDTNVA